MPNEQTFTATAHATYTLPEEEPKED